MSGKSTGTTFSPRSLEPAEVQKIREEFPILAQTTGGKSLVYLDSAASAQKPRAVTEAVNRFYTEHYANVHRGLYRLSIEATEAYEKARCTVAEFIGARDSDEIVFTSGSTGGINLVAHSFGGKFVGAGDEVLITHLEHHSNIVPWQMLCEREGATLRVAPINDAGELIVDEFDRMLSPRTRLVAVSHTSNALGTRLPVEHMIERAHAVGAAVLLDAAQALPHEPVDVRKLDVDFLVFSGHKLFAPTGIGVLYGKADRLKQMPPFLGGGEMIHSVSFEGTTFKEPPHRFEAGTPDIAGAVGLGAAAEYLDSIGMERIAAYEHELLEYATPKMLAVPGLKLIGTAKDKAAILSFVIDGIHAHDVGTVLDTESVAVRAGHHCAQPLMERMGVPATARASLAFYNTREDVDRLIAALHKAIEVLG